MNKAKAENGLISIDCPYCGQHQMVEVKDKMTPTEYQAAAAMQCDCAGSRMVKNAKKIKNIIEGDLLEDATDGVLQIVKMVDQNFFDKVTVKYGELTYVIRKNSEGVLIFQRKEQRKKETTL